MWWNIWLWRNVTSFVFLSMESQSHFHMRLNLNCVNLVVSHRLDPSKVVFCSARISYKSFLKWETLGAILYPLCSLPGCWLADLGLFTWWSDESWLGGGEEWSGGGEKTAKIFGWLDIETIRRKKKDIEAIKTLLGGLFSCKAWMLIWKMIVGSLCDAYKYSRK